MLVEPHTHCGISTRKEGGCCKIYRNWSKTKDLLFHLFNPRRSNRDAYSGSIEEHAYGVELNLGHGIIDSLICRYLCGRSEIRRAFIEENKKLYADRAARHKLNVPVFAIGPAMKRCPDDREELLILKVEIS